MNTHNIFFYGDIWKIIIELSLNILLICSTVQGTQANCIKQSQELKKMLAATSVYKN